MRSMLFVSLLATGLYAQTPWSGAPRVHPHIAEEDSSVALHYQPSTPLFNFGDNGVWDLGEGLAVDSGGALSFDDGTGIQLGTASAGHVHISQAWHDFTPDSTVHGGAVPTVKRLVGYLRAGGPEPTGIVRDAAFEVFVPGQPPAAGQQVVIILSLHQTLGGFPSQSGQNGGSLVDLRIQYPGDPDHDGLLVVGGGSVLRPNPSSARLAASLPHASYPYWPVCAYIVPRLAGRAQTLLMQRNLQMLAALKEMLTTSAAGWRPTYSGPMPALASSDLPVLVAGGSNGGTQAQMFQALFPDRIHGVFATSFPPNFSRTFLSDQERWRYAASLTGLSGRDAYQYSALESLSLSMYLGHVRYETTTGAYVGSDLHNHDLTRLWVDGVFRRPMFLEIQDEDTVGGGENSLPLLLGGPLYDASAAHGILPNGTHADASLYYTVIDKRCHYGGPYTSPFTGSPGELDLDQPVLDMIAPTVASWTAAPSRPARPPQLLGQAERPQDHALDPGPFAPASFGSGLVVDSSWPAGGGGLGRAGKHFGIGTWLGQDDSLVVHDKAIYVGSAEGIVSRLELRDPSSPTSDLQVTAVTNQALGYGAWALAVGEDIGGNANTRVIVGTQRRLHVLDGTSTQLTRLSTFDPGPAVGSAGIGWKRPRRIKLADVSPPHPGKEVVLTCEGGHLVVMTLTGDTLVPIAVYFEPGVADLEAGRTSLVAADHPGNLKGIHLLSERGIMATLSLGPDTNPDPMDPAAKDRLLEYSWDVVGAPRDMEFCTHDGLAVLAVLYEHPQISSSSLRVFFPGFYHFTPGFGGTVAAGSNPNARYKDLEVIPCGNATGEILVLASDELIRVNVFDGTGSALNLVGHPQGTGAAMHAVDMAIADVDDDPDPEVILSTEGGRVVWFDLSEFPPAGAADPFGVHFNREPLNLPLPSDDGFGNQRTWHTNPALSATWGMTAQSGELHVVDQAGGRWSLTGDGTATHLHDLVAEVPTPVGVLELHRGSPIYDLAYVGGFPSASLTSAAAPSPMYTSSTTNAPGVVVRTKPSVPRDASGPVAIYDVPEQWSPPMPNGWTRFYDYHQLAYDGFMPFHYSGDLAHETASSGQAYWWVGDARGLDYRYRNLAQGLRWGGGALLSAWSSSTSNSLSGNMVLRNVSPNVGSDLQALRLIERAGDEVWAVLSTAGGGVLVFDPGLGPNPTFVESKDYGFGGAALAVDQSGISGGGVADIFFASTFGWCPTAGYLASTPVNDPASSTLVWLTWDGSNLTEKNVVELNGLGLNPVPYGACGIAVGELLSAHPGPEVVVGTLSGHLLIFRVSAGALQLVQAMQVEGAIGAFNGLVIADLDGSAGNELYAAGSFGLRRFK